MNKDYKKQKWLKDFFIFVYYNDEQKNSKNY